MDASNAVVIVLWALEDSSCSTSARGDQNVNRRDSGR